MTPPEPAALSRAELVDRCIARMQEDPATRDRVLAEIWATTFQLEQVLTMMQAAGPAGIMRSMFGMRRRGKGGEDAAHEEGAEDQASHAEHVPISAQS